MSLITDISQVRAASSINVSNTLDTWQPYLDEAELSFIKPAIGSALFNIFKEKSKEDFEEPFLAAITLLRKPLALYALYLGIDEFAVSITSQGIQVVENDTHKPAPQYKVQNLKETWMRRAHTLLDLALLHLEANASDFPTFSPSNPDLFIKSASEFNKYVDIRSSRRVFLTLIPTIRSVESKYIKHTLSNSYFDSLKQAVQASSSLSNDDQAVMNLIQPALAHLTMARALQEISIDILDWGIFANAASTFTNLQTKQTSNKDRISVMIEANLKDGEAELKELQEYLDTNSTASKYSQYFNSDRFVGASSAKTRIEFKNQKANSIFVP